MKIVFSSRRMILLSPKTHEQTTIEVNSLKDMLSILDGNHAISYRFTNESINIFIDPLLLAIGAKLWVDLPVLSPSFLDDSVKLTGLIEVLVEVEHDSFLFQVIEGPSEELLRGVGLEWLAFRVVST
ncbi:hypothetical protein SEMRO_2828_G338070.1 [Seminavis robusta]|uniref:Uncharacterized protein n=1 Tax=Seminavis robusta TaxID=568900 RepID=A0A9N8F488_9STRA|nr:hypothetical protein SEMRO_2828_G338070.1 [Seminavis robusta]|eukprot:Sro2828_g338070.1 n/a (127) ;mRNA; r:4358-4738